MLATKVKLSVTRCVFFNIAEVLSDFKPNCSRIEVEAPITVLKSSPEAFEASRTAGIAPKVWLKLYPFLTISSIPVLMDSVLTPYCLAHDFDFSPSVSICWPSCFAGAVSLSRA